MIKETEHQNREPKSEMILKDTGKENYARKFMIVTVTVTANAKAAPVPAGSGEMSFKHSQVAVVGMPHLKSILLSPFRCPTNTKIFVK